MIIHSTTLDTEAKVKDIYGGTSWSKLEGVFLLGQSSDYAINSTGGSATNTLSVANLPNHSHGFAHTHTTNSAGAHRHSIRWSLTEGDSTTVRLGGRIGGQSIDIEESAGNHNHTTNSISKTTTDSVGSGTAINNLPPYKAVYIWERIA